MERETGLIERLIAESRFVPGTQPEPSQTISERISAAEGALIWEFFLPRVLYAALSLLFEKDFTDDVRLYLPIRDAGESLEPLTIRDVADLPRLGQILLGWHEANHSFATLLLASPPDESLGKYEILPLEDVLPADTTILPVGAHLALTPRIADLLRRVGELKPSSASARRAAAWLLKFAQDRSAAWKKALKARGDTLLYDSPTLTNTSLGEPLLNVLAEQVIALGTATGQPWRFCCILLPDDLLKHLMQRSLVVRGQSQRSPYQVGVTRLAPSQLGISLLAYQSGVMIYRSRVTDEDPAIAWREREEPISGGSALAMTVEAEYGKALGALYIVSAWPNAFPPESQQLLRMVGRMIGEQVTGSRGRMLTTANLADLIDNPQMVEALFKGFPTINKFRSELEGLLEAVKEQKNPFDQMTLVVVDITDLNSVALKYGDQAATKNLVQEVGQRLQEQAKLIFAPSSVEFYHAYVDRFYLLLKDFTPGITGHDVSRCVESLKQRLETPYRIYAPRVLLEQPMLPAYLLDLPEIKVRMAQKSYSSEELKRLVETNGVAWVIDRMESNLKAILPK